MRSIRVATLLLLTLPALARGQVVSLDEGSFTVIRAGERIGHENFSIRRTPSVSGPLIVAKATVLVGGRRVEPALNADSSGFPLKYRSELRVDARVVEVYSGQTKRDHYSSRAQLANGESSREFRLPPGTVTAEDNVIHHLWFIIRRGVGATVPVLVPSRSALEQVRIELAGSEQLTIDGRTFETRRLRLVTIGADAVREVWLDEDGRIVKAVIPALKLTAVRDER